MRFYYLVNSLELNSIFTTESISSNFVVKNRIFSPINCQNNIFSEYDKIILLFEEPPKYPNVGTSEVFAFKVLIELELDQSTLTPIDSGVWIAHHTIYLTPKKLKNIYVYDDYHAKEGNGIGKDEVLFNFSRNRYTKAHKRYIEIYKSANNFKRIEQDYTINISNSPSAKELLKIIKSDLVINTFKGALYSYILGNLGQKSTYELELLKGLEEIKNSFAIIKNRSANNESLFSKSYYKVDAPLSKIDDYKSLVKKNIQIYSKHFQIDNNLDYKKYEEPFLRNFTLEKDDILGEQPKTGIVLSKKGCLKILKKFMYSGFKKLFDDNFKRFATEQLEQDNPFHFCLSIYKDLLEFPKLYNSAYSKEKKESISHRFNQLHQKLTILTKEQILKKNAHNQNNIDIDIIKINSDFLSFSLGKNFPLKEKDAKLFLVICNNLLQHRISGSKLPPKMGVEYFKEHQELLIKIGKEANFDDKTRFKDTYALVYKYIIGELSFDIDSISDCPVQQNLAAFFFKPSNISELQEYLEAKEIKEKWLAYIFWGVFNGYSRIDKAFIKPLFVENSNILLLEEIDKAIESLYYQMLKVDLDFTKNSNNIQTYSTGDTIEFPIHSNKTNELQQPVKEESAYIKIKSKFEKIISNCEKHPNKTIKKYIHQKNKDSAIFKELDKMKDFINPHFIEKNIDEILKNSSISKTSKAYKEVISYHLTDLIKEINNDLSKE